MLLDTPVCDFGWQAPNFTLQDTRGKMVGMQQSMGDNGLLIAFICNHCPYVQAIADRLSSDCDELMSGGINVLAIMSNDYHTYSADSPAKMQYFADLHHFNFPYLIDETQSVANAYHAVCTPDFFGFNRHGELQYRGRLDSALMGDPTGRERELITAMKQIAETGQGPREQHPSMGCSIKWLQPG